MSETPSGPAGPPLDDALAGERIVVVGGGVGGLATAPYLDAMGADVTVLERNDGLGGVASRIEADGFRFDAGPSWYLMPDAFERYFEQFGHDPTDFYALERLDPHYRVFWKDGDSVAVPDDTDAVADIFESYEAGAGAAFEDYLDEAAETYRLGMDRFVYADRPRLRDWLDFDVVRSARALSYLGSMDDHASAYFDHPKLRQLVQYTLVFLGGAPHNTPALYNLLAHVDFELGVYYPEDGIYSVVSALESLGRDHGVAYRTGEAVTGIDPGPTATVRTDADTYRADRVVCNANPAHVERDLLPASARRHDADYWDDRTYAPSAFMLYLGVEGDVGDLDHHTLVLPEDWDPHFDAIFEDPRWPDDPAYYVNVPSLTDADAAPDGHHAVVVLVPIAPGLDDDETTRERFREQVLSDLAAFTGVDLRDRIVFEERACVSEFSEWVNAPQGTALGLAHTLRQTGPFRPGHRGPESVYYVGSYTTPGIGLPMCLVSAEHTARTVREDATERPLLSRVGLGE